MDTLKKIIIRVDGNSQIGLGHIYRGIALAEMVKDNFDILFGTRKSSTFSPINDARFKFLPENINLKKESFLVITELYPSL